MKQSEDREDTGRFLIIGYGNPLRGDDALGQIAAGHLARRYAADPRIDVIAVHQLTLELSERLARYPYVILIDVDAELEAGALYARPVVPGNDLPQPFSHYLLPGELLGITRALYDAVPETWLIGLGAASFDAGDPLSTAVERALPDLFAWVEAQIRSRDSAD